jgi:hypothetical protein
MSRNADIRPREPELALLACSSVRPRPTSTTRREPTRWRPAGALAAPGAPGSYLTDERTRLRVVVPVDWAAHHEFALLEDCATLDVFAFTANQLSAAHLRAIAPSRTQP